MTMTYSEALTVIESHLHNNWTATPVAYDNVEPLDYTDDVKTLLSDGSSPYIELKTIFADSHAAETGPNAVKISWGYINATFYSKESTGAKVNQTNIDTLCGLFEYQRIGGIVFKEMTVLTPFRSGGWYATPTMLRFYFTR